jgi:hypothetical protein
MRICDEMRDREKAFDFHNTCIDEKRMHSQQPPTTRRSRCRERSAYNATVLPTGSHMLVLIFFFLLVAVTSSGSAALTASEALVAPMVSLAASDDVDAARPRSIRRSRSEASRSASWAETLQQLRSRKADDSPKSRTRMVVVTAYYGSSMPLREVTWPNKVAYCKRHGYDAVDLYASDDVVRDGTRTLGHTRTCSLLPWPGIVSPQS